MIDVDADDPSAIREFLEKPTDPPGLPDNPDEVLASMGNYVFDAEALVEAVTRDADDDRLQARHGRRHRARVRRRDEGGVYDFKDNEVPGATDRDRGYWRDVGTMRSYYDAHMDVVIAAAGLQPLQLRVADLHRLRPAAAGQARQGRRRQRPGRRGVAALARGRGVRRAGTPLGAVAGRRGSSRAPWSRARC